MTEWYEAADQFLLPFNIVEIEKTQVFVNGLLLRQDTRIYVEWKSSYIRKEFSIILLKSFFLKHSGFVKIILQWGGQSVCFISALFIQITFDSNIVIVTLRSHYTHSLECLCKWYFVLQK